MKLPRWLLFAVAILVVLSWVPLAMIMGMPAAVTLRAALILVSIPPVPSAPGMSLA